MGTKIQDYDLEASLREITADIRATRASFGESVQAVMEDLSTQGGDNSTAIESLEELTTTMNQSLMSLEGMVGFSSAGEEDDEAFTYDPVTDDIIKHEVFNNGELKFQIEYSYADGNISEAMKTYMIGEDTVTVTTTFTYNEKGNVSAMAHRRNVVSPEPQV